ncbi:MAG: (p)ppGpp synthetase, partial [Armatimonadota bacterium]
MPSASTNDPLGPHLSAEFAIEPSWEEPEPLHDLLESLRDSRPDADVRKIRYAYYVAEQAHAGQVRQTGEPFILHPLAVAQILADLGMDDEAISAALLHDVFEDCEGIGMEDLTRAFGATISNLVDGVTKLEFKGREGVGARA